MKTGLRKTSRVFAEQKTRFSNGSLQQSLRPAAFMDLVVVTIFKACWPDNTYRTSRASR